MKNRIYGFFLLIFYILVIFYVVMFIITYKQEKTGEVRPNDNTEEVTEQEGYVEPKEEFEIHDDTSPKEIVNEYDDDVKNFFVRIGEKIEKFFTSDRDGRNLFEITNENILELFGVKKDEPQVDEYNNDVNNNIDNTYNQEPVQYPVE